VPTIEVRLALPGAAPEYMVADVWRTDKDELHIYAGGEAVKTYAKGMWVSVSDVPDPEPEEEHYPDADALAMFRLTAAVALGYRSDEDDFDKPIPSDQELLAGIRRMSVPETNAKETSE
jgi:hypothetical protein